MSPVFLLFSPRVGNYGLNLSNGLHMSRRVTVAFNVTKICTNLVDKSNMGVDSNALISVVYYMYICINAGIKVMLQVHEECMEAYLYPNTHSEHFSKALI